MKQYLAPLNFSGAKFALRYGLDSRKDFWIVGNSIFVPDGILDDPPIFETPDPPAPSLSSRIAALPETINTELKSILTELARGR